MTINHSRLACDWRQQLIHSDPQTQLILMRQIEAQARTQADAYLHLLPFCKQENFALRLRAFLALGRLQQTAAGPVLWRLLAQERQNLWRLVILDTLHALPLTNKITPLTPYLAEEQLEDGNGHFLCGVVWLAGQQGEAAIPLLSHNLLAQPTQVRRVKDSLLCEALWQAAGGNLALLQGYAREDSVLARYCAHCLWPKSLRPHYGIYPNPDFLLQNALKFGLTQAQFKQLFYWQRNKQRRLSAEKD